MTPVLLLLALVQPAATPVVPPLQLGFAKRAITPAIGAKPVYMAGFDNDRQASGVHDDLWARAVAVSDGRQKVAIVSVNLITSDFPHFLRGRMEERLGGTCVFLVGSIGGLMTPLGLKLSGADGRPVPADSFALAQAVGERAADAALEALANGRPSASSALEHRSAIVFVPLENRLFRLAAFLGVLDREMYSGGHPATTLFGDDMRTEVGYLRIGDAEALLVPVEIYPELVLGGIQDPQDRAPTSRARRASRRSSPCSPPSTSSSWASPTTRSAT